MAPVAAGHGADLDTTGSERCVDITSEQFERGTFLSRLSADDLTALAGVARRRMYPRGATLLAAESRSDWVLFLLRGRVKVSHHTADGRALLLAVLGPGEPLGEQSAIEDVPVHATATALDQVEVMLVSARAFREWIGDRHGASLALLECWSKRLRKADGERIEFVMNDTMGRVAGRLVELTERYGVATNGHVRIALPLSQEELGSWAGSSREATSRALQSLRRHQLIQTRRKEIMILDPEAMRDRADARNAR